MRKRILFSAFVSMIFCIPLLVFASDSNSTGTQASGWSGIEYIKIILSGAAGGLISSLFAIYIAWESNENALRINREKIKADQVAQDKNYKNQIQKLRYEEMRKACCDFLGAIDPGRIIDHSIDAKEVLRMRNLLTVMCDYQYNMYVKNISDMFLGHKESFLKESNEIASGAVEHYHLPYKIGQYTRFFNVMVLVTKDMLDGVGILPAGHWNIRTYEKCIPLDYRNRFL